MASSSKFDFYSKIKDIYIEIHNYTFYHNPDEGGVENSRFIGRKKQVERLEMMLTQSESKSGAYLVTGYRGMGKTSLVNQTLAHIRREQQGLPSIGRFLRWFLILALINIFVIRRFGDNQQYWVLYLSLSLIILIVSLYFIYQTHSEKNRGLNLLKRVKYTFESLFDFDLIAKENRTNRVILQDISIISIIILFFIFFNYIVSFIDDDLHSRLKETSRINFLFFIHLIIALYFRKGISKIYKLKEHYFPSKLFIGKDRFLDDKAGIENPKAQNQDSKELGVKYNKNIDTIRYAYYFLASLVYIIPFFKFSTAGFNWYLLFLFLFLFLFMSVLSFATYMYVLTNELKEKKHIKENSILRQITHQLNFGNFVPVRVNLGQDELKEIYILSLIAKNTHQTYKKWSYDIFFSTRQFASTVLYYGFVIVISSLMFYNHSSFGVTQSWREKSGFCDYFPSQALINLSDSTKFDSDAVNTLAEGIIDNLGINKPEIFIDVINRKYFDGRKKIKLLNYEKSADLTKENKDLINNKLKISNIQSDTVFEEVNKVIKDSILSFQFTLLQKKSDKNKNINDSDIYSLKSLLDSSIDSLSHIEIKNKINVFFANSDYKHQLLTIVNHAIASQNASVFRQFCIGTDIFIQVNYNRLKRDFTKDILPKTSLVHFLLMDEKNSQHGFIPPFLDYWYIIFLAFVLIFINSISRFSYLFGIRTPRYVINLLENLVENIDAQILIEKAVQVPTMNTSGSRIAWFSFRRQRSVPRLDAKAIENQLIYIMDEIDRIPSFIVKPKFIFIFDELDKIEPYFNPSVAAKEKEDVENVRIEGSRMRQEHVVKILGNLKHFLSTAKSKFIFIAGREMFDASLADASDREAYISSIFSDVLEVPSFYSDDSDNRISDITSLTEQFVCNYLIPRPLRYRFDCSLKGYNRYLKEEIFLIDGVIAETRIKQTKKEIEDRQRVIDSLNTENINANEKIRNYGDTDKHLQKAINDANKLIKEHEEIIDRNEKIIMQNELEITKRQKIILTLFNFITFLAYRSNGAPKKIAMLFEKHLIVREKHQINPDNHRNLTVRQFNSELYLKCDEYDQYRFGFTTYLFTPFLMKIGTHVYEMGDKLLVSTSFLLDHLYKYHPYGFSWRNLELTPEIIAINKSPHLRDFITDIINSLSQNHIREIISGLHDFKFNQKIASEIRYISSISEPESAAFNFTLDESLQIKRYYKKRLLDLKKNYVGKDLKDSQHIHAISFLHMILGDLHFYDQEYDDAILQYLDAIQLLRTSKGKDISPGNLVLLTRNMLKLGLTFERKRTYESALTYYGQMDMIINSAREVLFETLGFQEFLLRKTEVKDFIEKSYDNLINNSVFMKSIGIAEEEASKEKIVSTIKDKYFFDDNGNGASVAFMFGRKVNPSIKDTTEIKRLNGKRKTEGKTQEISSSGYQNMKHFIGFSNDFFEYHLPSFPFSPELQSIFYKSSLQEELRILYQPLIARLQILEKEGMQGITQIDLDRADKEFIYLSKAFVKDQKFMLEAEFNNKIGDILFYKNGYLKEDKLRKFTELNFFRFDIKHNWFLTKSLLKKRLYVKEKSLEICLKKDKQKYLKEYHLFRYDAIRNWLSPKRLFNKLQYLYGGMQLEFYPNIIDIRHQLRPCYNSYKQKVAIATTINERNSDVFNKKARAKLFKPVSAYEYYMKGCMLILKYGFKFNEFDTMVDKMSNKKDFLSTGWDLEKEIAKAIREIRITIDFKNYVTLNKNNIPPLHQYPNSIITALAYAIIDIADCILSFSGNNAQRGKFGEREINVEYLKIILDDNNTKSVNGLKDFKNTVEGIEDEFSPLDQVIYFYYSASQLFKSIGNFNAANSQRLKILYLLNDYINNAKREVYMRNELSNWDDPQLLELIRLRLVEHPIRYSYRVYSNSNRPEIVKLRDALDSKFKYESYYELTDEDKSLREIYRDASVSSDAMEFILIYEIFRMNLPKSSGFKGISNAFNTPTKNYNRLLMLNLKGKQNHLVLETNKSELEQKGINKKLRNRLLINSIKIKIDGNYSISNILDALKHEDKRKEKFMDTKEQKIKEKEHRKKEKDYRNDIFSHFFTLSTNVDYCIENYNQWFIDDKVSVEPIITVIIDSIYCFLELIKAYEIYGTNYISSFPTVQASAHRKLAFWCRLFYLVEEGVLHLDKIAKKETGKQLIENAKRDLQDLLGYEDLNFIYHGYHYEKTVECYDKAISMHTEGKSFFQFVEKMYYIDDDFNDDVVHFNIALERYRINTGHVHEVRKNLIEDHIQFTYLYRYDTYMEE